MLATNGGGKTVVFIWHVNHSAFFRNNLNLGEMVAFTNFEIVKIVSGRNLNSAGAILRVGVLIGDDFDFAISERQVDFFADAVLVAVVIWIDGNGHIAEQGFRSSSRNYDIIISDVPKDAGLILVFDFDVVNGVLEKLEEKTLGKIHYDN